MACAHCNQARRDKMHIWLRLQEETEPVRVELCLSCLKILHDTHCVHDPGWPVGPNGEWTPLSVDDRKMDWLVQRIRVDGERRLSLDVKDRYTGWIASRIFDPDEAVHEEHARQLAVEQWWRLTGQHRN